MLAPPLQTRQMRLLAKFRGAAWPSRSGRRLPALRAGGDRFMIGHSSHSSCGPAVGTVQPPTRHWRSRSGSGPCGPACTGGCRPPYHPPQELGGGTENVLAPPLQTRQMPGLELRPPPPGAVRRQLASCVRGREAALGQGRARQVLQRPTRPDKRRGWNYGRPPSRAWLRWVCQVLCLERAPSRHRSRRSFAWSEHRKPGTARNRLGGLRT